MPKERKLGEVFKTPWGKLKVVEDKSRQGDFFAPLDHVVIVMLVMTIAKNLRNRIL